MNEHLTLERDIKHAVDYAWKFVKRVFTNFWWTASKQSLLTSLMLAVAVAAAGISTGVIKFGDAANNVFAIQLILAVAVAVFLFVSIIRTPFQLDRELRETAVAENKTTEQPGDEGLPDITAVKLQEERSDTDLPQLRCEQPRLVNIDFEGNGVPHEDGMNIGPGRAFVVDFYLKPRANAATSVQVRTRLYLLSKEHMFAAKVRDGVWLKELREQISFRQGDTKTLVLAVLHDDVAFAYEHHCEIPDRNWLPSILTPKVTKFTGDILDIYVSLTISSNRKLLIEDQRHHFRTIIRPEPIILEIHDKTDAEAELGFRDPR